MNKHIAGAIILALASLLAHAQANDFPRRSITIIDPYPPAAAPTCCRACWASR